MDNRSLKSPTLNHRRQKFAAGLLRWVGLPLLLAGMLSWAVAPPYPQGANLPESTKPVAKVDAAKTLSNDELQKLNDKLDKLEDAIKQNYLLALDGARKQVDWWLNLLGILAAIMAIAGGLIPYLMGRKDKEIIEHDKAQIRAMLEEVRGMKEVAGKEVQQIHNHLGDAEAILKTFNSQQSQDNKQPDNEEKIREAVATVENDKTSDYRLRLRAEAIEASQQNKATKAYLLWAALTALEPDDEVIHFNAGYWAQELADSTQAGEKIRWLKLAGQHYRQALSIQPDFHQAANNWGNALADEANALSATDLPAARVLWQQAREKYQQALRIKPDKHEAANNWGVALAAEANALSATDLPAARVLWQQAREKYQQALRIKPDKHEAAYNWGNALADEANALSATDLPAARVLWQQAAEKYQQALRIKPDDHVAANNWGNALNAEANALSATDLPAARVLWQQAGEKYQQALRIKPDDHKAANNWGVALAAEANALSATDLPAARVLWQQAGEKYQQALRIQPDDHKAANNWGNALAAEASAIVTREPEQSSRLLVQAEQLLLSHAEAVPELVAYNLACVYGLRGDVQDCLKWLRVSHEHKTLPPCQLLAKDRDLDAVRNAPEFIEWFKQVCP